VSAKSSLRVPPTPTPTAHAGTDGDEALALFGAKVKGTPMRTTVVTIEKNLDAAEEPWREETLPLLCI
jgi:hypothetical protein